MIGLYARAGIDIVREHLACRLPGALAIDVAGGNIVAWFEGVEVSWELDKARMPPRTKGDTGGLSTLDATDVLFSRSQLLYAERDDFWASARQGAPTRVLKPDHHILPPAPAPEEA